MEDRPRPAGSEWRLSSVEIHRTQCCRATKVRSIGLSVRACADFQEQAIPEIRAQGEADGWRRKAIEAIGRGLVDADVGGGVINQRIAREGDGKSGGFRTTILFKTGERAFFRPGLRQERAR
jgi:hypothetical protein